MKDEGFPPSPSFSQSLSLHFSVDAGYAWQVLSLALLLPPPPSPFLSLLSLIPQLYFSIQGKTCLLGINSGAERNRNPVLIYLTSQHHDLAHRQVIVNHFCLKTIITSTCLDHRLMCYITFDYYLQRLQRGKNMG